MQLLIRIQNIKQLRLQFYAHKLRFTHITRFHQSFAVSGVEVPALRPFHY